MNLEKAKQLLKDWVRDDRRIMGIDEESDPQELSDYEAFCEDRNEAIEAVLFALENKE